MTQGTEKKHRILIVDDTPPNIQLLGSILQEHYIVSFAESGPEALSRLEKTPFDLILLDIMMPEMDGFEVCRRVRSNPKTKDIPIIFLSAKADRESVMKGLELGGQDYVVKPYDPRELLKRVQTQLSLREQQKKIEELSQKARPAAIPLTKLTGLEFLTRKQFYEKLMFLTIHENLSSRLNLVRDTPLLTENDPALSLAEIEKILLLTRNHLSKNKDGLLKAGMEEARELMTAFSKAELQKHLVIIREALKQHNVISNGLFFVKTYFETLKDHVSHTEDGTDRPVSDMVASVLEEVLPLLPETVTVTTATPPVQDPSPLSRDHLFLILAHGLLTAAESILSGEGEGDVSFSAYAHGGILYLEISDTGTGLKVQERRRLLRAFEEEDLGVGILALGLATVKELVETQYKGTFRIEETEAGTKTSVHIPLRMVQ
ncbi:response regulator [Spirochaeta thermophila]|uniref:Two-component regulatory system response regulator n=1 Tax=Winmispira thermophila (strain ATCC 49972 / DSM 6192 / RI 19.B1) TaxID=665571 RepID=E0RQM4_WINT6|nr:response regulator [Spirochaeta thermophila]ADN01528.1 two-component regulatory system response regulator [Spirochaeta thermophila DSM 6192]